jgi:Cu/Ag efflux pump CusA
MLKWKLENTIPKRLIVPWVILVVPSFYYIDVGGFIPVAFISGSAGVFYKQFGLTLAVSIVLSAINALTLSPALCAIF